MAKAGQVDQQWYVVDASDEVLGRLASDIAVVLMGKHRPIYTPHVDCRSEERRVGKECER